jgi:tetratricopeptide (TPR) repeat protein
LAELLGEAGQTEDVLRTSRQLLEHPSVSNPLKRRTLSLLGDFHWRNSDTVRAQATYDSASRYAAPIADRRALLLKRFALEQPIAVRQLLQRYILPPHDSGRSETQDVHLAYQLKLHLPHHGIGPYLIGRKLVQSHRCEDAIPQLKDALALPLPAASMELENVRLLARCQYDLGALAEAEQSYQRLARDTRASSAERLGAADWLDRIRWRRTGRAAAFVDLK